MATHINTHPVPPLTVDEEKLIQIRKEAYQQVADEQSIDAVINSTDDPKKIIGLKPPLGYRKKLVNMVTLLEFYIRQAARHKKCHLLQHAVKRAYESDLVLVALLRKLLPDRLDIGEAKPLFLSSLPRPGQEIVDGVEVGVIEVGGISQADKESVKEAIGETGKNEKKGEVGTEIEPGSET